MGGKGSGRHFRWNAKRTTESSHDIDIRRLKKWGSLEPGRTGTLSWISNGTKTGSVGYRIDEDRMILSFQHRPNGGEWEPVEQSINFDRTPCNYGGHRLWFLCPRCFRRVAVLYGPEKYFLCRDCLDLAYTTQQENLPMRLTFKAQKIRERLGASLCTSDPIWEKPKGMHWKTFHRLKKEAYEATEQTWCEASRLWGSDLDPFREFKEM